MRAVSYKSVLRAASVLWTGLEDPDAGDGAALNRFINRAVREFWERFWWPELMETERRYFRRVWSVSWANQTGGIPAGTEVYYGPTQKYYRALVAGNVAPATADGTTNTEWADAAPEYSADEWDAGTVYALGDQVYYGETETFYQLWREAAAGTLPTDTDYWGELEPFERVIEWEQDLELPLGDVRRVLGSDPRVTENSGEILFEVRSEGVLVRGCLPKVWVEWRQRCPRFEGPAWAFGTSYAVADQVYYDPGTGIDSGDFYVCAAATSGVKPAGDNVSGDYWVKIEFPYVLREMVAQGAYGQMLKADGQTEKWRVEAGEAERLFGIEVLKVERLERQNGQMGVRVRC